MTTEIHLTSRARQAIDRHTEKTAIDRAFANQTDYVFGHSHGMGDTAGYVVVATDWSSGELQAEDVGEFRGAGTYGDALELLELYRSKALTSQHAKVETIYLDGCRIR